MAAKGYQFVGEDENAYRIHDGEGEFSVAKSALSDAVAQRIRGLPAYSCGGKVKGYAEGGDVVPTPDLTVAPAMGVTPGADAILAGQWQPGGPMTTGSVQPSIEDIARASSEAAAAQNAKNFPPSTVQYDLEGNPSLVPSVPTPKPAAPTASPTQAAYNALAGGAGGYQPQAPQSLPPLKGYGMDLDGIEKRMGSALADQGKIEGQKAAEQYAAAQAQRKTLEDQQAAWESKRAEVDTEYNQAVKDFQNAHIDAGRLWNSRGGEQKAMAAVGLILGGIGAGLTHGPNNALQVIQGQIDRDIDAQKAELGKKANLVTMLYQKYGNIDAAANMAKLYQASRYEAALMEAATKYGGPEAQARARMAIEQMHLQLAPLKMQVAQFNWMQTQMAGQGGGQYDPLGAAPAVAYSVDKMQEAQAQNRARELPPVAPGRPPVLAHDEGAAKVARDRLAGLKAFEDKIAELEKENPAGVDFPKFRVAAASELARAMYGGSPSTEQIKHAEDLLSDRSMATLRGADAFAAARKIATMQKASIYGTYSKVPSQYFFQTGK